MFRILKPNGNIPIDFGKSITKGLIECFILNEYAGNDVFSSLTNNKMLNHSGVTHDNGVLRYDGGVNAYTSSVNMPDILFGLKECTIIVKCSAGITFPYDRRAFGSGDGLYQAVISRNSSLGNSHFWWLVILSTTGGRGVLQPNNVGRPDIAKPYRMDSVALVYDGNYLSLNLNGFTEGKVPLTGTIVANQGADMYLGRIKNHIEANLKGCIDHCYIWDRALNENELQQINNYPYSIFQDVYQQSLKGQHLPPPPSGENHRYWIAPGASNWDNTANWSNTSGGPSGFSVPIHETNVFFDSGGAGVCTIDTPANIMELTVEGYNGTLYQNDQSIKVDHSGASFKSGTFFGDGTDIRIMGDLFIGDTCTFNSTDATLSCDGTFVYGPSSGIFLHHDGVVSLDSSGCALDTPNAVFSTLQFNAERTRVLRPCVVNDTLILKSGSARSMDTSAIIHIHSDMTCEALFNKWNPFNNLTLRCDGSGYQNLEYHAGGVIPNLFVDKIHETPSHATESFQVKCHGDSPVRIKDYLYIQDGTFNTNGLDVQVGL